MATHRMGHNKARVSLAVSPELKATLKQFAKESRPKMSVNKYVASILEAYATKPIQQGRIRYVDPAPQSISFNEGHK